MSKKVMELNGMIYGQFPSMAAFSKHIGISKQIVCNIVNGKRQPTLDEVQTIAKGLEVPFMLVANFFLKSQSPNR